MNKEFWLRKWTDGDTGFHEPEPNPQLRHLRTLILAKGCRVFVPLCGKSVDIGWLLSNGYRVAGAEFSELAVEELFWQLSLVPDVSGTAEMRHYHANNIDIFVGDVFDVSREMLGPVDAVYDRAALVALPDDTRQRYADHVARITGTAPQLLITFVYDQSLMDGPPFSIGGDEVQRRYGADYELVLAESSEIPGGLKTISSARTEVWLLRNRQRMVGVG